MEGVGGEGGRGRLGIPPYINDQLVCIDNSMIKIHFILHCI